MVDALKGLSWSDIHISHPADSLRALVLQTIDHHRLKTTTQWA